MSFENYLGKIIIIGDPRIGKSSIINRYFNNDFNNNEAPTIGVDFNIIEKKINNKYNIKLQVWDTAGQERFNSIITRFFHNLTCVILVYDISNEISFNNIEKWIEKIEQIDKPGIIYLIGNKLDFEQYRDVTFEQGEELAKKYNARFFETSAKSNINNCVNNMFDSIINDVYNIIKYNPDKLDNFKIKKIDLYKPTFFDYIKKSRRNCCYIM